MATNSPHPTGTSAAGSSALPNYALKRPAPQRLTRALLWKKVKRGRRDFCARIRQTLGFFESMPRVVTSLTLTQPAGAVSESMLQVCESLASDSEARLEKLEAKATGLLSLIAVVIPLTASAAVFIRQNELPAVPGLVTLGIVMLAMLSLLLGLVAALRAVAVRGHDALFLDAVIDKNADRVRDYNADFFGRGLLYVAASRHAICDHIGDFVRAAQLFLVLGVLFAAAAAIPVLFYIRNEAPPTMHGTVSIDPDSLNRIQSAVEGAASAAESRLGRVESDVRLLKEMQAEAKRSADIERLSAEIEELRRQLKAQSVDVQPSEGKVAPTLKK
jgi:hypothetical protein